MSKTNLEIVAEFKQAMRDHLPHAIDQEFTKSCEWLEQALQNKDTLALEMVKAERQDWIDAVGQKIDLPTRKLIEKAFHQGFDYCKELYDDALQNLTKPKK